MRTKRSVAGMDSKRQITFENQRSEKEGIVLLGRLRKPFTYSGRGKYIITKEQCLVLKTNEISYEVKRRFK